MKKLCTAGLGIAVLLTSLLPANAQQTVTIKRKCINATCGQAKYIGGRVKITVESKLTRTSHFNFRTTPRTNPDDQIELGTDGKYSFEQDPGNNGTYDVQACDRGGIGARSTCSKWATFVWSSGEQEESEEQ